MVKNGVKGSTNRKWKGPVCAAVCRMGLTGKREHVASPQVASLWPLPGGEGNAWWNRNLNRWTISSVSATTLRGLGLLLTRETEEMWEARHETERSLLAIVSIARICLVTLQQLSSLGQRAKIGLAQSMSPPSHTPLCVQWEMEASTGGGRVWYTTGKGYLKVLEVGHPALVLTHEV